ncbi:MAG: site-specific DNA-methyltransferase [Candidatus Methanomethylophilaceae archaeon]
MSDKLDMHTKNIIQENIEKIGALFPHCVTEATDEHGEIRQLIDFESLRQELSEDLVSNMNERYRFIWPDKLKFQNLANEPVSKTLRPYRDESVNFDNTRNLYIEGDNLDVLKLLRETYLNKVHVVYIDPPYNTGNDFVYKDNFKISGPEFENVSGLRDEEDNKLFRNTDSNGRFHTDWLNMMYPRLKLARDLLNDEGLILISIDENESHNLKKICDELFGERNFIGDVVRKTKSMTGDSGVGFNLQHEYLQIYAKDINRVALRGEEKDFKNYSNPDDDVNGDWCPGDPSAKSGGNSTYFPIANPHTGKIDYPPKGRYWAFSKTTLERYVDTGRIKFKEAHSDRERGFVFKRYKKDIVESFNPVNSLFAIENEFMNSGATAELSRLFDGALFDYPKPVGYIKALLEYTTDKDSIILDFFSGSATTAHAVIELNTEDGGDRKYIMIQLPEETDKKSDAYKAGFHNICELGKERIRRVGEQLGGGGGGL